MADPSHSDLQRDDTEIGRNQHLHFVVSKSPTYVGLGILVLAAGLLAYLWQLTGGPGSASGDVAIIMTTLMLVLFVGTPLFLISVRQRRSVTITSAYFEYRVRTGSDQCSCRIFFDDVTLIRWCEGWDGDPLLLVDERSGNAWYADRISLPIADKEWDLMLSAFERFASAQVVRGLDSSVLDIAREWDIPQEWSPRKIIDDVSAIEE